MTMNIHFKILYSTMGIPLVILGCLVAPAFAGELQVGAAVLKITPPNGIGMAGYYYERGAQGTLDDLYAKAIVLEKDGESAALVGLDLISTTFPMVEAARSEIEKITKIRGDHVMISATHAHTGPVLANRGIREASQGGQTDLAATYSEELPKLIAECVRLAHSRLQSAQVAAAIGREEHLSYNRRFHMKDGTVGWNPGKLNPNIVEPAGPIDPDVGVVYFDTLPQNGTSQPIAAYVNFAMHADTVGGEKFSADYAGALSRSLAAYKGVDMVTLFANGACGNVNHFDVKWADPQHGPHEANRIGTILAAEVLQTFKQLRVLKTDTLRIRREIVQLPLPEIQPGDAEKARVVVEKYGMKDNSGFMEKVQAYKILDVDARKGKPLEVEVQGIALGDELAWVSLGGEFFVELGLDIKKRSPFQYTMIAELANGSIGYVPNRSAYLEGNYEVVSARCAAGSGEMIVDAAVNILKELKSQ